MYTHSYTHTHTHKHTHTHTRRERERKRKGQPDSNQKLADHDLLLGSEERVTGGHLKLSLHAQGLSNMRLDGCPLLNLLGQNLFRMQRGVEGVLDFGAKASQLDTTDNQS